MGARDHSIDWARQREVVEAVHFSGFILPALDLDGSGDTGVQVRPQDAIDAVAAVFIEEVSTVGITAVRFTTAGGQVRHTMAIPSHWDLQHDVGLTLQFCTGSATAEDGTTWKGLYDVIEVGEVLAAPTTALDTAWTEVELPADPTALTLLQTNRGVIEGGNLKKGGRLVLDIEMDTSDVALDTEKVYLLSLTFDYMPKWCWGAGVDLDRDFSLRYDNQ